MVFAFIAAVVLGIGLSIHPGASLRRAVRETLASASGVARVGAIAGAVAVEAAVLTVVALLLLALPDAFLASPVLRGLLWIMAGGAIGVAGWRRIESSPRLDLRREGLTDDLPVARDPRPWVDAAVASLSRRDWHLFWWIAAPGLLVAVAQGRPGSTALFVSVYAASALLWPVGVAYRVALGEEKVVGTITFRVLHSLGGLALVGVALFLLVQAFSEWRIEEFATREVIRPLFGLLVGS